LAQSRRLAKIAAVLVLMAVGGAAADTPVPMANPGFEESTEGRPAGWEWGTGREAKASLAVDTAVRHGGAASVRLTSSSPTSPHVYGSLAQRVQGLQPRRLYRLTFWAKGDGVGVCWFGGGREWAQRVMFPTGTYDWRQLSGDFETGEDETSFELRINVDSVTAALWLDDVTLRLVGPVIPNGAVTSVEESGLTAACVYPVPRLPADPLVIDGDLNDWARLPAPALYLDGTSARLSYPDYGGPADLSATVRLAYDAAALYLAVVVTDDVFHQPLGGPSAWWNDNVQLAFDPLSDRTANAYGADDRELSLTCRPGGGDEVYELSPNTAAAPAGVWLKASRQGAGGVTYEARIEWSALGAGGGTHGRAIGFNVLLNDSDDDRRGYLEWTEGIGVRKDPSSFATLLLVDPAVAAEQPAVYVRLQRPVLYEADLLAGNAWVAGAAVGRKLDLRAQVDEAPAFLQTEIEPRTALTSVTLGTALDAIPFGPHTVAVSVGAKARGETAFERSAGIGIAKELIDGVERDLPALEALLVKSEAAKVPTDYQRLRWRIATLFVAYGRDDLAHGEVERAVRVGRALRTAVDEARDALLRLDTGTYRPPLVPRYRTGRIEVVGRSFIADTEVPSTGLRERRPVFFTGYGHFGRVREHLPIMEELGANIIQIENGPSSTLPAEDRVDTSGAVDHVVRSLELGRDHHVAVCLLVSPHYFPDWALQKWPELGKIKGGFVRHSIDAAESKAVQAKHLGVLLPLTRGLPSLHSVCLSNEPIYQDCREDPVTRGLWPEYLLRTYRSAAEANAVWGSAYTRLEDVPVPSPEVPEKEADLPLFYDWCRFNMERFAGWHAWEAEVVRSLLPGLPCHAKIMPTILERRTIGWGVDPELFSRLSQVNGNDCWEFLNRGRNSTWAFNWSSMGVFYDLQCALAEKPVFNTENHIIVDRDMQPVPPEHTYTAIWQGAIHGQGATTTWVWERTYDPKHDFAGSILHRPENAIAHGEAGLDLMRLAREVTALQNAPRRVALLYSVASIVNDPEYLGALDRAYTALNFSGLSIGFRSERQVAAGEWGETRLLLVPRARFVPPAVRAEIARWASAGGSVVLLGPECLGSDPYRRPFSGALAAAIPGVVLADVPEAADLRQALLPSLRAADCMPAVGLADASGSMPWGVEWRCAEFAGQPLLNLVNLTREPQTVHLGAPGTRWRDLIAGGPLPSAIVLAPMKPVLAIPAP
jgi:hypothetical protein